MFFHHFRPFFIKIQSFFICHDAYRVLYIVIKDAYWIYLAYIRCVLQCTLYIYRMCTGYIQPVLDVYCVLYIFIVIQDAYWIYLAYIRRVLCTSYIFSHIGYIQLILCVLYIHKYWIYLASLKLYWMYNGYIELIMDVYWVLYIHITLLAYGQILN